MNKSNIIIDITIMGITHLSFFITPLSWALITVLFVGSTLDIGTVVLLFATRNVVLLAYSIGLDSNAYKMYIK